jgi:hypothetical protein
MAILTQTIALTSEWSDAVALPILATVEHETSASVDVTIADADTAPAANAAHHTLRLGQPEGSEGGLLATMAGYAFFRSNDSGVSVSYTPIA